MDTCIVKKKDDDMKNALMQPYLFPYLGYFSLIKNTDHFTFFDTPQYIRRGWINRNRILACDGKCTYFTVPVEKCQRETAIKDVKISYKENWVDRWKGQLTFYKKRAPYYDKVIELVDEVVSTDNGYISNLAINSVIKTCKYLGISLDYDIYSDEILPDTVVQAPDEWALHITKAKGYTTYVNPPGGKKFYDAQKYRKENVELLFLTQSLDSYYQGMEQFVPGLSIIDVMMFCSPKEILGMLDHFVFECE